MWVRRVLPLRICKEYHAPWMAFLPFSGERPVLAAGLRGSDLASLGRSFNVVHAYKCLDRDIMWAEEQLRCLGYNCRFERVGNPGSNELSFPAIVINEKIVSQWDQKHAISLLESGGSIAWISGIRNLLTSYILANNNFAFVHSYALLPPATGKIVVSLGDSRFTRTGLDLYIPNKWHNRLVLRLAKTASEMGFQDLLGLKKITVARRSGNISGGCYFLPWLGGQIGKSIENVTLYTGHTKLVLQLLDYQGNIIGLAKIADMALGRKGIRQETAVLKRLKKVPELKDTVPRILFEGDWQGHTIQVQTAAPSTSRIFKKRFAKEHISFLTMLSRVDRCNMPLENWPFWKDIWNWAQRGEFESAIDRTAVREGLKSCYHALRNVRIPFHRIHGDFTPWNVILQCNRLTVVDWEHSERVGLPLFDIIHFATQVMTFIKEKHIPFDRFLSDCMSILSVNYQINTLISSASLVSLKRLNSAQMESLIRLCLIRFKMRQITGK